jgi:RecB family exonuclease
LESTSFTQISYFTQCPLRFGLLFDYGFERTAQPQFYYGISVHRALERFFGGVKEGTAPTENRLMNALDTEWIDRGYAGDEQEKRFKNKAEEILQTYLRNHEDELDRIEYVEHPFSIIENDVRIEGKMDRVDRLPTGELRVIDFKVGELEEPGPWESFQLHLYALACERTLDENVADCRFHFLTSDEPVPIEYNDAVRERTLNRLQSVLSQMENREYPPNPGDYCDRCDFRGFCPAVDY